MGEYGKKYERKRGPDGLSLHDQHTILVNITLSSFIKCGKSALNSINKK